VSKQTKKAATQGKSGGANKAFYLIIVGVVVLGGAALVLAGMNRDAAVPGPMSLADTEVQADAGVGLAEGAADAPATLVEFADYQCPACAQFNGFTGKLLRQNYVSNGMLRWVVYEFPLDTHPNAVPAAIAGRCAGDQGRFWQMRDLLFASQREWYAESSPNRTFESYADDLGLDRKQFAACLSNREHLAEIMSAKKYGESLGVNSTPTLFMNGQPIPLTRRSYEALEEQIKALAAHAAAAGEVAAEDESSDAGS